MKRLRLAAQRPRLVLLTLFALFAVGSPALAAEPLTLRVLSYNIHHGEGLDGRLDLERIAAIIRSVEPDLVALQELDRGTRRTGEVDQPAELARLTDMQAIFGPNIEYQGGDYGNAILSKFPVRRQKNHALPSFDDGEQRGVLDVEVELPGDAGMLRLLCTHLDHRRDDRQRRASAEAIERLVSVASAAPMILAGDLNDVPDSPVMERFRRSWSPAGGRESLRTIPSRSPRRQIDYILYRPEARFRVVEVRVLDEPVASDHRPIFAVLELLPAEENR